MRIVNQQQPVIHPTTQSRTLQQMTNHVRFLEKELERINEELQVRVDRSRRERSARDALSRECDMLREEVGEARSALEMREHEIYELDSQLRASQAKLVLMKRRYAEASAAVSAKSSPPPGTISSYPKEMRTIGTQINDIKELEERIERLTEALMVEKKRNQRIKSLMVEDGGSSANPPLPQFTGRGVSVPALSRRRFTTQCFPATVIRKAFPRLTRQSFIQFNSKSIPEPPPTSDSPVLLLSPIKRVNHSVYSVFEDKENGEVSYASPRKTTNIVVQKTNVLMSSKPKTSANQLRRSTKVPDFEEFDAMIPVARMQPPPFVPQLNFEPIRSEGTRSLPNSSNSSESAIKRAVAAAVEKRKQLASQGILLGSSRSNISTSSLLTNSPINVSGVKARFCLPLS